MVQSQFFLFTMLYVYNCIQVTNYAARSLIIIGQRYGPHKGEFKCTFYKADATYLFMYPVGYNFVGDSS